MKGFDILNIDNQQKQINIFFKYNNHYDYQRLKDGNIKDNVNYMNNRIHDELNILLAERYIVNIFNSSRVLNDIEKTIGTVIDKELKGLK